jgi:hypothetical protein
MTPFKIGDFKIAAGTRKTVELPISVMANHTPINLPVHVIHGTKPGPTFFISGVVHGDEILGVEIVRRVVSHSALKELGGNASGGADRQYIRLSQPLALYARQARSQPLIPGVGSWLTCQPVSRSLHEGSGAAVAVWH